MDLGEAVYRAITNGRSPRTEVGGLVGALGALRAEAGSTAALARELDVSRSTLRGWLAGRTPKQDTGWVVQAGRAAQRRARLSPGRERRLRRGWPATMGIVGTFRYDGGNTMRDTEAREIEIGRYMDDAADELVDAYLDGESLDTLAEIFHGAINDHGWYAETFDPSNPDGGWDIDDLTGWGD